MAVQRHWPEVLPAPLTTDAATAYQRPPTNTQRAVTKAEIVCSAGSMGVDAEACIPTSPRMSLLKGIGGRGLSIVAISRRAPSDPPAARATASASARARATAVASAVRRASSVFEA